MWLPRIDTGNRVRTLDSLGNSEFERPWCRMSMHKKSERGQHDHPNHPENALYNMSTMGASSILIVSRRNTIWRSLYPGISCTLHCLSSLTSRQHRYLTAYTFF